MQGEDSEGCCDVQAGIGHNGGPPLVEDTPIHRIRGGQIMIAKGTVHGVTALTWTAMCDIAVKEKGDRYWMTRTQTARMVEELRGGAPVALSSISGAWRKLQRLDLIKKVGIHPSGATIWQINPEPALRVYAQWRDIYDRHRAPRVVAADATGGVVPDATYNREGNRELATSKEVVG